MDATLEEVVALSDSVFGYIYYYSEETEEFTLHAWSKGVMESCRSSRSGAQLPAGRGRHLG